MRTRLILRIIFAVVFSLTAFIFTEVLPDIPPYNRIFLRIVITLWFGLVGYGLFPDMAHAITQNVYSWANIIITRITDEIVNRMNRVQLGSIYNPPMSTHAPLGGVAFNQPLILDTSAIIDGRILDIAKTNFLSGTILLPAFVLTELQQVADSSDFIKRGRGRRGFEIIEELKKIRGIRIEIWDKEPLAKAVDDKLIKLAKNLKGKILTTDYNLNRVATVSGVVILNINDLANAVKTQAIPGENLTVKVIHLGKDTNQGVGYLQDGTMVVVEDGSDLVGQTIKTQVSRMLQSSAGRMIFVRVSENNATNGTKGTKEKRNDR